MHLNVVETNYVGEDHSWLGSAHALDTAETITLDLAAFDADQYPDGFIPSGFSLGVITASGKFGAYDPPETDGRETNVGHLAFSVQVGSATTGDFLGAMIRHGIIIEANLPANDDLDANGKTDVAGQLIYR